MPQPKLELSGPVSALTFSSLSYTVKVRGGETKLLIDNVSMTVRSGEMVGKCVVNRSDSRVIDAVVDGRSNHGTFWCR